MTEYEIIRLCDRVKELARENTDLKAQIDDIKANCGLAIEGRDIKIKELEQKNKELEKRLVFARAEFQRQYKENAELKKENAELKERYNKVDIIGYDALKNLTKAKKLLEKLLITSCNSDVLNLLPNCSEVLRVRVEAEQFLTEVEK